MWLKISGEDHMIYISLVVKNKGLFGSRKVKWWIWKWWKCFTLPRKKMQGACLVGTWMNLKVSVLRYMIFFSLMNVDLKWQCCPSPFCNIPKKPLIEKRTPTVTHLLLKKEPQQQRRLRAEEQGGQLENGWWKLGDRVVGDEVGEAYKFWVRPFRWYLHSHTHVENLNWFSTLPAKIDFGILKSILPL